MKTLIYNELKSILTPQYFISYLGLMLITWRLCLPPFQINVIYDSHRILNFYLLVISTAGMFCFFLLQILQSSEKKDPSNKNMLAVKVSGKTYLWGMYISYYIIFLLAFLLPALMLSMVQQMIFAPERLNFNAYIFAVIGFVFSFINMIIFLVLCLILFLKDEFMSLFLFLSLYFVIMMLSLFSGIELINTRILKGELTGNIYIYFLVWCACSICLIAAGNYLARNILYNNNESAIKPDFLSRIARLIDANITAHHILMMDFKILKLISIIMMLVLIILVVLNHSLKSQISQLVNLFLMIVMPFVFSCNQSFIFKIDHDACLAESIVLNAKSYIRIILNRWFILVFIQLMIQITGVFIVHFYSQSLDFIYIIYILLLGVLISLINLIVNVSTGSIGFANILIFFLIYIQLNESVGTFISDFTSSSQFVYPEASLVDLSACIWILILNLILLIITTALIQKTKYANLRIIS